MKTKLKDISKTKKKIELEVPAKTVNESFQKAYTKVRQKADVKGFRKGKVPNAMLDRYYAQDIIMESLNNVVSETFPLALKEHTLVPLTKPNFDALPPEKEKDYSYTVEFEVKPPIELKEYKGINIKKREVKIEKKEIDDELKRIQEARATLKPAEDNAGLKEGLVATFDFEGTINGEPFKGGNAKGYVLEYGKGHFLKEFEDKMAGMKAGEERTIEITFPKDYFDATLQNKKAQFKLLMQAVHTKEIPPLDDDLAKDLGKENLGVVKKEVEEMLGQRKERSFRSEYAKEIIDYLIKKHPMEVPKDLLEQEIKNAKKEKTEVENDMKARFILEEIAKKESIQVQPPEIEARFKQLSQVYQQPVATIKKYYIENQLVSHLIAQLAVEKTLDFVIDNATLK